MGAITVFGSSAAAGEVTPYYEDIIDVATLRGDYATIGAALTAAAARTPSATNRILVRVHAGIYVEALTMVAFVDVVGVGSPEAVIVRQADATVMTLAANSLLGNLTLDLNAPTAARNMVVDAGTGRAAVVFRDVRFTITTPGAFAHRVLHLTAASGVTLEECEGNPGGGATVIVNNETAGATITLIRNDFGINTATGFIIRSVVASTIVSRNNAYRGVGALITASLGTVRFEHDSNDTEVASAVTGGEASWKSGFLLYEVFQGFRIGDAIAAAAADVPAEAANSRYTILVHSGLYVEALTMVAFIDVKGVGPVEQIVIRQADATVVTLASNAVLEGVTFDLNAPTAARNMLIDNAVALTAARLRDCRFTITTPGAFAHRVLHLTAGSGVDVDECVASVGGGATVVVNVEAAATVTLRQNDFDINTATGAVVRCTAAAAIRSRNNSYIGIGQLLNSTLGTILFERDSNDCEVTSSVTGGQAAWKTGHASYEVFRGFRIGDALAAVAADTPAPAAGNRYELLVHPGTYTEALAPTGSQVTIAGLGPAAQVIITQVSGNLVTLANLANVVLKNLTLQLTAGVAGDAAVALTGAGASTGIRLEDVVFDLVGAAAGNALYALNSTVAFAHTVTLLRASGTIGGTGISAFIRETTGTLTATVEQCLFTMNSANGFIVIGAATVLTVNASETLVTGTGGLVSLGAAAHRVTFNGGALDMDAASVNGGQTVWKTARQTYRVVNGMVIGAAITAAAADTPAPSATGGYVVEVYPGLYVESLSLSSNVAIKGVGLAERIIIRQADGVVVSLASPGYVENVTLDLNAPTAARNMVEDLVVAMPDIRFKRCIFVITTPGAFAHRVCNITAASTIILEECSANVGGGATVIVNNETAGATITLIRNDFGIASATGFVIRSTVAGTIVSRNNAYRGVGALISASLGTVRFERDSNDCEAASSVTGGQTSYKGGELTYEVFRGFDIAQAIAAAAADTPAPAAATPYVVHIHPGLYTVTAAIVTANFVSLRGDGIEAVTIRRVDGGVFTLSGDQVTVENLTVDYNTPTQNAGILNHTAAVTTRWRNVRVTVTTPGAFNSSPWSFTANPAICIVENCSYDIAGSGANIGFNSVIAATLTILGGDFRHTSSGGAIHISQATGAGAILVVGALMRSSGGTGDVVSCIIAGGVVRLNNTIIDNSGTGSDVTCSAGIVRIRASSVRRVTRTATGNVVDESHNASPVAFRAHRWTWAALDNVNSRVAVGGAVALSGGDAVRLRINDNAADVAGTDQLAEAAGAQTSAVDASRTPRMQKVFAANAFRTTTRMFYGLRATLGNAVPGAAEIHAGFDWDGTNFRAISSDGAGVGVQTNLATPSVAVWHFLEVIVLGGVQVEFLLDGQLVATHSAAAGRPTGAMDWQSLETSTGAGAATNSDVTEGEGFLQECRA